MQPSTVSIIGAAIALISALASAAVPAYFTATNRDKELNIEFVKLGLGILRADPKEAQTNGAREWAVAIVEQYSGMLFSPEARSELRQHQLRDAGYTDWKFSSGFDCTFIEGPDGKGGRTICALPTASKLPPTPPEATAARPSGTK
jgi:hypothetical protein